MGRDIKGKLGPNFSSVIKVVIYVRYRLERRKNSFSAYAVLQKALVNTSIGIPGRNWGESERKRRVSFWESIHRKKYSYNNDNTLYCHQPPPSSLTPPSIYFITSRQIKKVL